MRRLLVLAAALLLGGAPAAAGPVLMISVDGLRPTDVIEADAHGLKVPNLRRMMAQGAYAEGVTGVLPTLTYPSHATLITGVAPARHGVGNNLTFDPTNINQVGWDWYAEDIKAPTLWSAARAAGLRTVNVHWPVSVGAPVDYNLPQIWRTGHDDDRKLMRALATPGLLDRLEHDLGPYAQGIDESVEADENRVRFAAELIAEHKPALTTVYLASVDHNEHALGPGSPEALVTIARNDTMIGRLVAAARATEPDLTVVVVSDHGFQAVSTDVNLLAPFIAAGLITFDAAGKVTAWQAEPWFMGGSAGVVLARPDDPALVAKVASFLAGLKTDPEMGIAELLDREAIAAMGGASQVSFLIAFRPGFQAGHDPRAAKQTPSSYKGMHGYLPVDPAMRSSLFVEGPGLARHGSLGQIDMRAIAPSVARVLRVALPTAEAKPVF
ncbi:alkaline phosphatase family protein [Sphingomonas crusticola]|uniref:alkaline phosphatase family protein n=1 Tax=Sphingomonas crusticola TaxID=1697973 RepID=UPI000E25B125|nr:ectonucleotide pyrophosphatase/phosphodiesterase [Sphingomonas crusticola]